MAKYKKSELVEMAAEDPDEVYLIGKDELKIPQLASMTNPEILNAVLGALAEKNLLIVDDGSAAASGASSSSVAAAAAVVTPVVGKVLVRHGAHSQEFPNLVGKTIAQAHAALRDAFSIDENPRIYLNGNEITNLQHTLAPGEMLEFQKRTSAKGK